MNKRRADGLGTLSVSVELGVQIVRKQPEFKHKKYDGDLDGDHQPEGTAHGHRGEAATVEFVDSEQEVFHGKINLRKFTNFFQNCQAFSLLKWIEDAQTAERKGVR